MEVGRGNAGKVGGGGGGGVRVCVRGVGVVNRGCLVDVLREILEIDTFHATHLDDFEVGCCTYIYAGHRTKSLEIEPRG